MATFARVPVVPGPVLEIYIGEELFPMHESVAGTFHAAPDGTLEGYRFDGKDFTPPATPVIDSKTEVKAQIAALEVQQTPRRIREYALGEDDGWLKNLDAEIAALRTELA